jgi:hypothetical protein
MDPRGFWRGFASSLAELLVEGKDVLGPMEIDIMVEPPPRDLQTRRINTRVAPESDKRRGAYWRTRQGPRESHRTGSPLLEVGNALENGQIQLFWKLIKPRHCSLLLPKTLRSIQGGQVYAASWGEGSSDDVFV